MAILNEIFSTCGEVKIYADSIARGVASLAQDVNRTMVWDSPAHLSATADELDTASKVPGNEPLAKVAAALRENARTLTARAASRPAEQVDAEISYATAFFAFRDDFEAYRRDQVARCGDFFKQWEFYQSELNQYDSNYRRFYDQYKTMGYTPSLTKPASPTDAANEHPTDFLGTLLQPTNLLLLAGLGAAAYFVFLRPHPQTLAITTAPAAAP